MRASLVLMSRVSPPLLSPPQALTTLAVCARIRLFGHRISGLLFSNIPSPSRPAGHNYIGTEHILLGLLREGEGVAARVLETLGADPAKIRTQVSSLPGSVHYREAAWQNQPRL